MAWGPKTPGNTQSLEELGRSQRKVEELWWPSELWRCPRSLEGASQILRWNHHSKSDKLNSQVGAQVHFLRDHRRVVHRSHSDVPDCQSSGSSVGLRYPQREAHKSQGTRPGITVVCGRLWGLTRRKTCFLRPSLSRQPKSAGYNGYRLVLLCGRRTSEGPERPGAARERPKAGGSAGKAQRVRPCKVFQGVRQVHPVLSRNHRGRRAETTAGGGSRITGGLSRGWGLQVPSIPQGTGETWCPSGGLRERAWGVAKQRCGAHLRAGASRHTGSRAFVWPRPFRFPFFHPRPEAEEEERGARGTLGLLFPSPQVSSLKPRAGSEPHPPRRIFPPRGTLSAALADLWRWGQGFRPFLQPHSRASMGAAGGRKAAAAVAADSVNKYTLI